MQKTDYTCNVCGDILKRNCEKTIKPFLGMEFDSNNHLVVKNFNNVHRHFCKNCLEDLDYIYNMLKNNPKDWNVE